jgi:IS605 OrfB family transposase
MPPATVHRTCRVSLRLTTAQRRRCFGLLRAGGDVWAWALDSNRARHTMGLPAIASYPDWCRQLARRPGGFGALSVVGARSVLRRYADAWGEAARRRRAGKHAGFPRRKRRLVPVRFYHGTFMLEDRRLRLQVARGQPPLWLRLARPVPCPAEAIRSVTLLYDGIRLVVDVTAALPVEDRGLDPGRAAGVDLGIIYPYAVMTDDGAGLLVSGRAVRAEDHLHLVDRKARARTAAHKAPRPGQHGSRRWRRYRRAQHRAEVRHRRRVHQAHHEAAKAVVAFAIRHQVGILIVGDPRGITDRDCGKRHNLRLRQWRRTHLVRALRDKAERAGIRVELVDERGSSSTCPACHRRVPKPTGRQFACPSCGFHGHRDLVGARNIAATRGGGGTSTPLPVEHRRAGVVPARRDRRRHLHDGRGGSCLASGRPAPAGGRSPGCRPAAASAAAGWRAQPYWLHPARIRQRFPTGQTSPEGALPAEGSRSPLNLAGEPAQAAAQHELEGRAQQREAEPPGRAQGQVQILYPHAPRPTGRRLDLEGACAADHPAQVGHVHPSRRLPAGHLHGVAEPDPSDPGHRREPLANAMAPRLDGHRGGHHPPRLPVPVGQRLPDHQRSRRHRHPFLHMDPHPRILPGELVRLR